MERIEKEYYNTINSALLDQSGSVFGSRMEDDSHKRVLEERNHRIAVLQSKLLKESTKLKKVQYQWERLNILINSGETEESQLVQIRKIIQDYKNDLGFSMKNVLETDGEFISRLKREFPKLSSNDLRICSLLRQNFSTKEVAYHLGIGSDSANKARYRIRKKLNLLRKVDLIQFILEF